MPHTPGLSPETPHQGYGARPRVELAHQVEATTAENFGVNSVTSLISACCSWQVMVWKSNIDVVDYGDVKAQRPPLLTSSSRTLVSGLGVRA